MKNISKILIFLTIPTLLCCEKTKQNTNDPVVPPAPQCNHVDSDNNHLCDLCYEVLSQCSDNNKDHLCDICGKKLSDCSDNNKDHCCDTCGQKITDCIDNNEDNNCDICGISLAPLKSIADVKAYIETHPVSVNEYKCGVNESVKFTIQGYAIGKLDLVKTKKAYGLNVSYPAKTIIADSTGWIACASSTQQGSLYYKVADYQCQDTSRYEVTGYISIYLGQPELCVTSFKFDKTLKISWNASTLSKKDLTIKEFYEEANNVYYNCAGHGYGDVFTLKNLTCYNSESGGQDKRYYNFTDGNKNIRVNAFNLPNCSEGYSYDITGIISLKNYSPIILAFSIKASGNKGESLNYETVSSEITCDGLRKIKGSQDDTMTRYPDLINVYGNFYKTTGYLTTCMENGNLYIGIRDTYYSSEDEILGKTNAMANYGLILIKNDNFWNTSYNEVDLFNPYSDYVNVNETVTIYFTTRQLTYSSNKPLWEILLIPQSLPEKA